jgi:hypothetical protein
LTGHTAEVAWDTVDVENAILTLHASIKRALVPLAVAQLLGTILICDTDADQETGAADAAVGAWITVIWMGTGPLLHAHAGFAAEAAGVAPAREMVWAAGEWLAMTRVADLVHIAGAVRCLAGARSNHAIVAVTIAHRLADLSWRAAAVWSFSGASAVRSRDAIAVHTGQPRLAEPRRLVGRAGIVAHFDGHAGSPNADLSIRTHTACPDGGADVVLVRVDTDAVQAALSF